MSFALTTDPILTGADVQSLLQVKDSQQAIIVANGLAAKFKRWTNRVQINESTTADIIESIVPYGGEKLYLHAPIWTGTGFTIQAKIYQGGLLLATYTLAGGDIYYFTNDIESGITLPGGLWPDASSGCLIKVTYKGGWADIPGDVIQGAIMQARVDVLRMGGEVGINSRGAQGESTAYQTAGIVKEVADLWAPYRMVA
jgi:hypothetical protein